MTSEREVLAHDVEGPKPWSVTATVNPKKGSSTPDEWKPPLRDVYYDYATTWIAVKSA